MKIKYLLLLLNMIILQMANGQPAREKKSSDPFCQMIRTIYSQDALRFTTQFKMKQVFEKDTVTSFADVIVLKNGTSISYLQIVPRAGDRELLFCNDSAWLVNHPSKSMLCLGNSIENAMYSEFSVYFSYTLFSIDTLIAYIEPYWKVIDKSQKFTIVSLTVNNASGDLSDIRAEFTIGNNDLLPYGTLQESVYLKADKLFQQQIFSDYSFPASNEIIIPGYYIEYQRDLSFLAEQSGTYEEEEEFASETDYLPEFQTYDLSGNPFPMPDNGLVFLDFWYVGCPPCMKSARIVEDIYTEYKEKIQFYSVNETDSDTAKINRFKDKMGISFPVLLGGNEKIAPLVTGNGGYPVFILFDAENRKILWKFTGYNEELKALITNAINQNL
jgi:thiol-disulfide isomerase/thioredoxin